jgi:hypothetical protein
MAMLASLKRRRRLLGLLSAALVVGALLQLTSTNPAVSQAVTLTAYEVKDDPGLDPMDPVWDHVSSVRVPLSAQNATYPTGGSVATVRIQAVHYDGRVFLRVNWADATKDDSTLRAEDFADAVAVEFPADGKSTIPSLCMGQADAAVNIWQWRADSNAGLADPNVAYPNALVDFYPQEDPLYFTAREAGNPYANPGGSPVQNLTSQAFGALTALQFQDVDGLGARTNDGWAVVFARKFEAGSPGEVALGPSSRVDIAFAVWDGANDERNGRKAVSQFVKLNLSPAAVIDARESNTATYAIAATALLALTGVGIALGLYGYRQARH